MCVYVTDFTIEAHDLGSARDVCCAFAIITCPCPAVSVSQPHEATMDMALILCIVYHVIV